MPTYEYLCKSCGEHTEAVQSFRDDSLTVCPNCGGVLRKVFGNIGIAFKGSGFYKNDSRPSGTKKTSSESADSGSSTNGASKSDSSTGPASGEKSSSGDSAPSSSNGKTSSTTSTGSGDSPKSPAKP